MAFITAEQSAFIDDGNWFNACVRSDTSTNPEAAINNAYATAMVHSCEPPTIGIS